MRRLLLAAVPITVLAFGVACGDGGDSPDETPTGAAGEATATLEPDQQPQVPDKPLPSPTPIPDDVPVVQVVSAAKLFAPLRSEFAALPKTKISAGGKDYEGVTLAVLAEQAAAGADTVATIQGTRTDNLRFGAIRFPLSEIAGSTVLVLDDSGHVLLASSAIPPEQWLKDITGIALN